MFEAILLLGLLGLFASHRRLEKRVAALGREIADMGHAPVAPISARAFAEPEVARGAEPDSLEAAEIAEPDRARFADVARVVEDASVATDVKTEPAQPAVAAPRETLSTAFERLVGGRLLIWVGGIAMALAGLFLVRYSIELGLIGPRVRMWAAAGFGSALLAGGEWARRRFPDDPRVGQALVGAGVLILYATAYGSHVLYGLIGLGTAFALMAAVAAAALGLSLRHGTPTAALGLVAGFLTPLLVGRSTGEAAPLLGYLTLLNLAVFAVAVRGGRHWLGYAAKFMTLGWTAWLLVAAPNDALLTGGFLLAHMVATGLAWRDEPVPSLGPTLALLQIGAVVPLEDFGAAGWAMLFAAGVAGFALADRSRVLAAIPGRALTTGLLLVGGHALAEAGTVAPYAGAVTLLFAGGAAWHLQRGIARLSWTAMFCAAVAGPALLLRLLAPELLPVAGWGALLAILGLAPAFLAWTMRARASAEPPFDRALLIAAATAVGLIAAAMPDLLPRLWEPAGWMLVALAAVVAGRRLADGGVLRLALLPGGAALIGAAVQAEPLWERLIAATYGAPVLASGLPPVGRALALFAGTGALAAVGWRLLPVREAGLRRVAGIAAAALGAAALYILFKQVFALRTEADFVGRGFAERAVLTQGLFLGGWLLWARAPTFRQAALALTGIAAARFLWFDLVVLNPAAVAQDVGTLPVFNLLLPACLGSAWWMWAARERAVREDGRMTWLAGFLAAVIGGAGLLVRQAFQGTMLVGPTMSRPEFYGYSLAGLALSVALLVWGWRRGDRPIRVAGLALLTATVVKVFAVDAAALSGVLRILSFAGLGAALIGVGKLYGTLLGRGRAAT